MHFGGADILYHSVMVIPAYAGTQAIPRLWIPAYAGMTFPLYIHCVSVHIEEGSTCITRSSEEAVRLLDESGS